MGSDSLPVDKVQVVVLIQHGKIFTTSYYHTFSYLQGIYMVFRIVYFKEAQILVGIS